MRVLVLGGTEFVGRAFVESALERGWHVTTLNRQSHPAPETVESLRGNRWEASGLDELGHDQWDLVVDTWAWAPIAVRDAAQRLATHADRYLYVSSRSVYEYPTPAHAAEDAPLVASRADLTEADYPQAKAGGELAVAAEFGERALLLRPGLILGPHENIGRLAWWLRRIERGGDVLAPGPRDLPVQYVDARDLAEFGLDAAASGLGGAFNVVSPEGHTTMGELLDACVAATGSDARLRWASPERLLNTGIDPWTHLPIWLPPGEAHDSMHCGDVTKAIAAELRIRPLSQTVGDTWEWLQTVGEQPQREARAKLGLESDVEARVLSSLTADD